MVESPSPLVVLMDMAIFRRRIRMIAALYLGVLLIFTLRLFDLQVIGRAGWVQRATELRLHQELIRPRRGTITDRNGTVLAIDVIRHEVRARLLDVDPAVSSSYHLARIADVDRKKLLARWRQIARRSGPRIARATLLAGLTEETAQLILKRKLAGIVLRSTQAGWIVMIDREVCRQRTKSLDQIATITGTNASTLAARLDKALKTVLCQSSLPIRRQLLARPVPLATITFEQAAQLSELTLDLPGIEVGHVLERKYPLGDVAPHAIGYTGLMTGEQATRFRKRGRLIVGGSKNLYPIRNAARSGGARLFDSRMGRTGIEARYDEHLAGSAGGRIWERQPGDTRVLDEEPSQPGKNVTLTLDTRIQKTTEEALDSMGEPGGAVLLDCQTGEVLVMASSPRYDLRSVSDDYSQLKSMKPSPLHHRAVWPGAPPGSTVKLITAAAALSEPPNIKGYQYIPEGPFTPSREIMCQGFLYNMRAFTCHGGRGHGLLNIEEAIGQSCNIYFYALGEALGEEGLQRWFRMFGLGDRSGIDLPNEGRGLVPMMGPGGIWSGGTSRNVAIGQGDVLATPLQMARVAAAIANGGRLVAPYLVTGEPRGTSWSLPIEPDVFVKLRRGMRLAVTDGTAAGNEAQLDGLDIAGKTGTAQSSGGDHAWFLGFAPTDEPKIAFCVWIEHGGYGAETAAPVAGSMVRAWMGEAE